METSSSSTRKVAYRCVTALLIERFRRWRAAMAPEAEAVRLIAGRSAVASDSMSDSIMSVIPAVAHDRVTRQHQAMLNIA
jgi:hypothetical protein